jgi:23S rRNA pseudouridine2457 synthase
MTAAVGHPTLRLVRVRIGRLSLGDLAPGAFRRLGAADRARVFAGSHAAQRRAGTRTLSV